MNKTLSNKLTYISFILAILIVIRHTVNIDVYTNIPVPFYYFESYISVLTDICVPLFFMVSGFLFFYNYESQMLLTKYKKRLFSLVIPFFIWNLIAFLYYLLLKNIPLTAAFIHKELDLTVFGIVKEMFHSSCNATWFLLYLIVYSYITPLLYGFLKKNVFFPILLGMFALSIGLRFDILILQYWFIYLIGAMFGIYYKSEINISVGTKKYILLLISFVGISVVNLFIDFSVLYMPIRAIQGIILFVLLNIKTEKKPAWFYKISFFIYVTHSLILEAIEKVIFVLIGDVGYGAIVDFFVAPICTLGLIFVLALLLRKIKPLWKILCGNR